MSNKISLTQDHLVIEPQGIDKLLSFKNKLEIPFEHLLGATIDKDIVHATKGLKGPGTDLPHKTAGTWSHEKEKIFWNVGKNETPLVIRLKDEHFSMLVLGVQNPKQLVYQLNNLVGEAF